MTKYLKIVKPIFLLIIGSYLPISLVGQAPFTPEKTELLCDRSVYICGESILFTGILSPLNDSIFLSEVVYTELISPDGQRLSKSKFNVENGAFNGQLAIPYDAISGYYYLRSYTKWMRNGSPENYAYVLLKLINPFNDEIMELADSLIDTSSTSFEEISTIYAFENTPSQIKTGDVFTLQLDGLKPNFYKSTSLSIVPQKSAHFVLHYPSQKVSDYEEIKYIPETRGLTISGKVIDKNTKQELPYFKVNIHIKNDENFICVLSDSSGKFHIALPEKYGVQELFIIAGTEENKEIEVLIDKDYCTKPIRLKIPRFELSKKEKTQFLQMAQTVQLHDIYQKKDSITEFLQIQKAFYGKPFRSIDFDYYIDLDSLSQYFTDIPSWVNIKKHKGKRELYLSGPEVELHYTKPLILIDWVPVDIDENVLKMDHRRIKKFDVIVKPYIHGSIIYGGVINIFTRKNDFGGFQFPESAMYINYDFYSNDLDMNDDAKKSILSNTSSWKKDVSTDSLEQGIELNAPSVRGLYEILLQTIDEDGIKTIYKKDLEVL